MSTPPRVTADVMGATVFNTKQATLEWTPEGRIRIVQVEPGEPPVLLLDAAPHELSKVTDYTFGNPPMLVFAPQNGKKLKVSLQRSMLAPEPNESAHAYGIRQAQLGVPPQSWWADSLRAAGANVKKFGAGWFFGIVGLTVVGVILIGVIAYVITEVL